MRLIRSDFNINKGRNRLSMSQHKNSLAIHMIEWKNGKILNMNNIKLGPADIKRLKEWLDNEH